MIRSCRLPSDLMGLLSTAAVQHERVAAEQDLPSIKRQVEAAMIMFSCAAVLDSSRRTVGAQHLWMASSLTYSFTPSKMSGG